MDAERLEQLRALAANSAELGRQLADIEREAVLEREAGRRMTDKEFERMATVRCDYRQAMRAAALVSEYEQKQRELADEAERRR